MSQPAVKWGQVHRCFTRRGYFIYNQGGDSIIAAQDDGRSRSRQTVRIGHRFSHHHGSELLKAHLSALQRAFGVTRKDILADK